MKARFLGLIMVGFLAASSPILSQEPLRAVLGSPSSETTKTFQPTPIVLPEPLILPKVAKEITSDATESHLVDEKDSEQDWKPTVRLRGRINADAIFVGQSYRNQQIFGIIDNAVGFRRARLGAEGEVGTNVYWVAEFDFAGGNIAFRDVFIGLQDLPVVRRLQVGHMTEPFSLEGAQSSNSFDFNERSVIYSLDPDRNWGVLALSYTEDERATCQFGVFRSGTSNNTGDDISNLNDMAYDLRITGLPWYEQDGRYLMHIGGAFSDRFPANGDVVIGTGPQNSLLQFTDAPATFIEQITIPANQYQLYNLQWATVLGPLSLQAEWNATSVEQRGGGPVFLNGCYAFASYFVTGENRDYITKDGKFGTTHVRRPFMSLHKKNGFGIGPGAWELVARFAYARFTNGNIPLENGLQQGDNEAEAVLGVNWYLNDNTRLMFNYVHILPVDPNNGPSYANAFFFRCAIFW